MSDNLTLDNTNINQRILREYLNQKRDEYVNKYTPKATSTFDFTRLSGWDNLNRQPKMNRLFEQEVLEPLVASGIIDRNSYQQLISQNAAARSGAWGFGEGGALFNPQGQKAAQLDLINNLVVGANANSMLNQKQFQTAVEAITPGSGTYQNTLQDNTLNDLSKAREILNETNLSSVQKNNLELTATKDKFSNQNFVDKNIPLDELGGNTIQQQLELTGPNAIKTRQLGQLIEQGQQPQNRALDLQEKQIQNRKLFNFLKVAGFTAAILTENKKGD